MTKTRLTSGVLFLCLTAALAVNAQAAGRVDTMRGDVQMRAVGSLTWAPIVPGQKITDGTALRTGTNSSADIKTDNGHHFIIQSESTVQFKTLQDNDTQALLEQGRVRSKVKKLKQNENFALQTPTAVCAVRGTEFDTAAGRGQTVVAVYHGVVGVAIPGGQDEVRVLAGQMTNVHNGAIDVPRPIPQETKKAVNDPIAKEARHEVGLDMDRNAVIAAAAMERRLADYTEGKSMIDVEGRRVRLDEYVVRTAPNEFKFVTLNERDDRLDYFYYKGTFNQTLPADLSVALKDISGKLGPTAPDYYLTAYEMGQSNTRDSIQDIASGGHLVQIDFQNDGTYLLTDAADPTNTKIVEAAELLGSGDYKVYNPLSDSFSIVTAAQVSNFTKFGVYIPDSDSFKDLASGDTFWKTRYNDYTHLVNDNAKITYTPSGSINTLVNPLDATWTYAGGFVLPVVTSDPLTLDKTITNYYGDGTFESYRTVLIDDLGNVAPISAFDGISSGAEYKGELLKWNYEQQISATEFEGRKIDIVVEPKIFIKSGLIQ